MNKEKNFSMEMKEIKYKAIAISASGVSLFYGEREIFDDINFAIPSDNIIALVGPNGSGKTTLLRLILGQELPDSGEIKIPKKINKIGYMPQSLSDIKELSNSSVYEFMLSVRSLDKIGKQMEKAYQLLSGSGKSNKGVLERLGELQEKYAHAGGYESEGKIKSILSGLQIPKENLNTPISLLSGGMKTRVFMARVLYSEPDILIMDEPTNHLDEEAIKWLGDYLKKFKGTGIIISHNQEFLDKFTKMTLYINPLTHKIETYKGNYSFFLDLKSKKDKQESKIASRQEKEIKQIEAFVNRWRAGSRAKQAQSRAKKLEKISKSYKIIKKEKEVKIDFPIKEKGSDPAVIIEQIVKSYNGRVLFKPLSFSIRRRERIAIMGLNGVGKTTLLKMIVGLETPDEGRVGLGVKTNIGYYAQEHELLNPQLTPIKQLENDFGGNYQRIKSVLSHFLLSEQSSTPIFKLSQGEKSRLALAKVVMSGANFLVLDEPTNHLDVKSRKRLNSALSEYEGTILTVSHDEEYLSELNIDRILILPEGKWIYGDKIK